MTKKRTPKKTTKKKTGKEAIKHKIEDANEFILYAFEQSKEYDPDNLKESFNKYWTRVLIADKKLKE